MFIKTLNKKLSTMFRSDFVTELVQQNSKIDKEGHEEFIVFNEIVDYISNKKNINILLDSECVEDYEPLDDESFDDEPVDDEPHDDVFETIKEISVQKIYDNIMYEDFKFPKITIGFLKEHNHLDHETKIIILKEHKKFALYKDNVEILQLSCEDMQSVEYEISDGDYTCYIVHNPENCTDIYFYKKYIEQNAREGIIEFNQKIPGVNNLFEYLKANKEPFYHPGEYNDVVLDLVHPSIDCLVIKNSNLKDGIDRFNRRYVKSKYRWLPSDFYIVNYKVLIPKNINNLPNEKFLYKIIKKIFDIMLPGFQRIYRYLYFNEFGNGASDDYDFKYETFGEIDELWKNVFTMKRKNLLTEQMPEKIPNIKPTIKNLEIVDIDYKPYNLNNSRLQVVTKIVEYKLEPQKSFKGVWHFEGLPEENIIMTGIYYAKQSEELDNMAGIEFKRMMNLIEEKFLIFETNQVRHPYYDKLMRNAFVPIGKYFSKENDIVIFPNCHAYRVMPMINNTEKTLYRQIVVFFIVDPLKFIHNKETVKKEKLTPDKIKNNLDKLMKDRKFHKGTLNPRKIDLCEH